MGIKSTVLAFNPGAANAEWRKSNNKWWFSEGNSSWAVGWKYIDGKWYYFDSDGYMKTGWLQDNGKQYYLDDNNGYMVTGWNGTEAVDWKEIDGRKYCFNENGEMAHDVIVDGYYINAYGQREENDYKGEDYTVSDVDEAEKLVIDNDMTYIMDHVYDYGATLVKHEDETNLSEVIPDLSYYGFEDQLEDQSGYLIAANDYPTSTGKDICYYFVTKKGGKVYRAPIYDNKIFEIYQIENNHQIAMYPDSRLVD